MVSIIQTLAQYGGFHLSFIYHMKTSHSSQIFQSWIDRKTSEYGPHLESNTELHRYILHFYLLIENKTFRKYYKILLHKLYLYIVNRPTATAVKLCLHTHSQYTLYTVVIYQYCQQNDTNRSSTK